MKELSSQKRGLFSFFANFTYCFMENKSKGDLEMKNKKWLGKPITWRRALRVSGIGVAISLLGFGIYYIVISRDSIVTKLDDLTNLVKNKLNHN